ncbi:uncharacterized protein G2W53_008715 [Senna tora]|uniref:Uncharacterized protein n=1 Tax=Senna tora TaxID=362788 RepID=A0A834X7F2_9FABA|nr:uncharacterized protein G2W53_008715 [Senna tora]
MHGGVTTSILRCQSPSPAVSSYPACLRLVIWPYDLYTTPSVQPNTFMGGVVVGHDAWGIAGTNKEGSALDSLF